ncbi:unnamed protein product [Scytosiphon promiscuus]
MCCGGGGGAAAGPTPGSASSSSSAPANTGNNPLIALQQLAVSSNASSRDPEWEARTSDRLRLLLPPLLAFCCLHSGWRALVGLLLDGMPQVGAAVGDSKDGERDGGGCALTARPSSPFHLSGFRTSASLPCPQVQVSSAARHGLDAFRGTLAPLRWLELRGVLLERLCAIAEGMPALAKSADERRLRAAFDLMAGYLSLLKSDARAALDGRLSLVLSCLCEALEFDEDFNVQVLEGSSSSGSRSRAVIRDGGTGSRHHHEEEMPRYYRQVFVNVREDSTLSSARRAVALLGKYCDLPSLADAAISSLETRPPRPPPPPSSSSRRRGRRRAPNPSLSSMAAASSEFSEVVPAAPGALDGVSSGGSTGDGGADNNDAVYRQRCLKWLRLRLPLAWMLNQAFLGRVPGRFAPSPDCSPSAAAAEGGHAAGNDGGDGEQGSAFLGRGFATSVLERLLASHALALPVSRAEAAEAGYRGARGTAGVSRFRSLCLVGVSRREQEPTAGDEASLELEGLSRLTAFERETRSKACRRGMTVLDANATLVSTVLEAMGSLAEASGQDCGEAFLRRALYPLLEKVASPHPVVSQAALATLSRVRLAFGVYGNMSQLVEANMDYIVDDVVRRVSSSRKNRGVGRGGGGGIGTGSADGAIGIPSVVEAVLRIGGSAVGPALVRDLAGVTLREVDACAWDPRQTRRSLGVLRAVASCVTLPPLSSPPGDSDDKPLTPGSGREEKKDGEERRPGSEGENGAGGTSALAESPWFRQLFVEFADEADIRRVQEDQACLGEGEGDGSETRALLQETREHREVRVLQCLGHPHEAAPMIAITSHRPLKARYRDVAPSPRETHTPNSPRQRKSPSKSTPTRPQPDAEGRRMAESEEVKTLSEVLSRSCHFLATPSLETQALALACMRDCVLKLASAGADAALLPHVHRAWRPLMASLREHLTPLPDTLVVRRGAGTGNDDYGGTSSSLSSRRAVLLHALDTVDALVDVCGDFLASKVAEDLWPLLKLLLLQYAASKNATTSTGVGTTAAGRRLRRQESELFSSFSRSTSASPREGLLLVGGGNGAEGSAGGLGDGIDGGSRIGGLSSLLVVPPGGSAGGAGGATDGRPKGSRHGNKGWRAGGTLGEKVVARALECLERLCSSQQCERFMTPLAREVALSALPCLSCTGAAAIRSRAEALFRRLSFLDGDSVWLLLVQTVDISAREGHAPQKQEMQQRQQQHREQGKHAPPGSSEMATAGGKVRARNSHDSEGGRAYALRTAKSTAATAPGGARPGRPDSRGRGDSRGDGVGTFLWLPDPPSPQAMALAGMFGAGDISSGRPAALLEMRSLFGGGGEGRVARECVPAAERLLASLTAGATDEHM